VCLLRVYVAAGCICGCCVYMWLLRVSMTAAAPVFVSLTMLVLEQSIKFDRKSLNECNLFSSILTEWEMDGRVLMLVTNLS